MPICPLGVERMVTDSQVRRLIRLSKIEQDQETAAAKAGMDAKTARKYLRTGLSWADSFRPDADRWFDAQMKLLEPFDTTVTFCFTPEHCGILPNHTSPPKEIEQFADFCARMTRRYC
jgi:beta-xylosidase